MSGTIQDEIKSEVDNHLGHKEKRQPLLLAVDETQYLNTEILNDTFCKIYGAAPISVHWLEMCTPGAPLPKPRRYTSRAFGSFR